MKRIKDTYKPVEIELEDADGNVKLIRSQKATLKMLEEIEELQSKDKSVTVVTKMLSVIFGGKPEEYKNYSVTTLYDVVNYWKDESQNPNRATGS